MSFLSAVPIEMLAEIAPAMPTPRETGSIVEYFVIETIDENEAEERKRNKSKKRKGVDKALS